VNGSEPWSEDSTDLTSPVLDAGVVESPCHFSVASIRLTPKAKIDEIEVQRLEQKVRQFFSDLNRIDVDPERRERRESD